MYTNVGMVFFVGWLLIFGLVSIIESDIPGMAFLVLAWQLAFDAEPELCRLVCGLG